MIYANIPLIVRLVLLLVPPALEFFVIDAAVPVLYPSTSLATSSPNITLEWA